MDSPGIFVRVTVIRISSSCGSGSGFSALSEPFRPLMKTRITGRETSFSG